MPDVQLRPLVADDLPFLCEVRHHRDTIRWLHDGRTFSLDQARQWFADTNPCWYTIYDQQTRVGYIRIAHPDVHHLSIQIGLDIHPDYRRRGFATAAYRKLLAQLKAQGWHRVWFEVLPTNRAALDLYQKLGFAQEGRKRGAVLKSGSFQDSVLMSLLFDEPTTENNVKVIVVYLGDRRGPPRTTQEAIRLLEFVLAKEQTVDPGCPMDTLLVYNRNEPPEDPQIQSYLRRGEQLLTFADGTCTPGGRIRLLVRQNLGFSFAGYNHAFAQLDHDYDHWLFTEDDQVMVKDGYYAAAINQIQSDPNTGFVAIVGTSKVGRHPPHAHGGVGLTTRRILYQVRLSRATKDNPFGDLPHHIGRGYDRQEALGEISFTNAIHQLGYNLVDHDHERVCISWGHPYRRTRRMTEWVDPDQDRC